MLSVEERATRIEQLLPEDRAGLLLLVSCLLIRAEQRSINEGFDQPNVIFGQGINPRREPDGAGT